MLFIATFFLFILTFLVFSVPYFNNFMVSVILNSNAPILSFIDYPPLISKLLILAVLFILVMSSFINLIWPFSKRGFLTKKTAYVARKLTILHEKGLNILNDFDDQEQKIKSWIEEAKKSDDLISLCPNIFIKMHNNDRYSAPIVLLEGYLNKLSCAISSINDKNHEVCYDKTQRQNS